MTPGLVSDLLVSQLAPVYPAVHLHVYSFTLSVHVPPFQHGLLLHSFMSTTDTYTSEDRN